MSDRDNPDKNQEPARQPEASRGKGSLPRRRFLQAGVAAALTAGAGGLAARLGPLGAQSSAAEGDLGKHQWAFVIDLRRCDGCEKCTKACQEAHYLHEDQTWIKVYELQNAVGQTYYLPVLCQNCENPPCAKVCPVGATYRVADGPTLVDSSRCIGCRMCMAACPYGVRYFNWEEPRKAPAALMGPTAEYPVPQVKNTVGKCASCVHEIRYGKLPACVKKCSMEAIYLGDLVADLATNGTETVRLSTFLKANDAVRLKEELNTRPRVYYIPGHAQDLDY